MGWGLALAVDGLDGDATVLKLGQVDNRAVELRTFLFSHALKLFTVL